MHELEGLYCFDGVLKYGFSFDFGRPCDVLKILFVRRILSPARFGFMGEYGRINKIIA